MNMIDNAIMEIEEEDKKLKKLDELINRLNFVVETIEPLLWDVVEEYYKHTKVPLEMKELIKDDPVLKYVLSHKIPDGLKRNAVLFKNLAIAFVHSEFSETEIREFAKKIVANCPGKNIEEFMGWVRKIKKEPNKWKFNDAEMNEWIKMVNDYEG